MEMGLATVFGRHSNSTANTEPYTPTSVVKSAARTIRILEFFDTVQREAHVREISRALKLPQSSTSVLLHSLVAMGYLDHDRVKRTYVPTRRVSLLGNWIDATVVLQGPLLDLIHRVSGEIEEAVALATVNGLNVQYIYVDRPALDLGPKDPLTIGAMHSLGRSAIGAALLSSFDDVHVAKLLRRINAERFSHESPINIPLLGSEIIASRQRGFFAGNGALPATSSSAPPYRPAAQTYLL